MIMNILRFISLSNYRIKIYINIITNSNFHFKIIKKLFSRYLRKKYLLIINSKTKIGEKLLLPHPQNVVIGMKCIIGNNCTIYQNVTIGQNRDMYPIIGDNVIIYAGAVIVGNIRVGNNVIIGANAVVTKNIPDNVIVGGNPAKIIKYRSEGDEFY